MKFALCLVFLWGCIYLALGRYGKFHQTAFKVFLADHGCSVDPAGSKTDQFGRKYVSYKCIDSSADMLLYEMPK